MSEHLSPVPSAATAFRCPDLRLDWCSHEAARYACERWHYSRCVPAGKLVKLGVWEDGCFIGAVIFGRGANNNIGSRYNLRQTEMCELVRVALRSHLSSVSRILKVSVRKLCTQSPGMRLIISYADPSFGHYGGIYQAAGWQYIGRTIGTHMLQMPSGQLLHKRSAMARFGTCDSVKLRATYVYPEEKHAYLLPLDAEMRARIAPLSQPYPKRVKQATDAHPAPGGGAAPTHTLQGSHDGSLSEISA